MMNPHHFVRPQGRDAAMLPPPGHTNMDYPSHQTYNVYPPHSGPPSPLFDETYIPETVYNDNCQTNNYNQRYEWSATHNLSHIPTVANIKNEPVEGASPHCIRGDLGHQNLMAVHDQMEKYKLERKRERNRIAASKCRLRKLERISELDAQVSRLKAENAHLGQVTENLRNEVKKLQEQIRVHIQTGCHLVTPSTSHLVPPSTSHLVPPSTCRNPDSTCQT